MKNIKPLGGLVGFALLLTFLAGAPAMAPAAQLTGSLATGNTRVNLTDLGLEDWAIWGYSSGGTSISLSPNASNSGGTAISSLTAINPNGLPLRGTGQFSSAFPATWDNGTPTASANGVTKYTLLLKLIFNSTFPCKLPEKLRGYLTL